MALVKCKECGSEISNKAASCPRCGAKVRRTSGCAWLVLILFGLLIVPPMLTGFNGARDRAEGRTTRVSSTTTSTPTSTPKAVSSPNATPVVSTITDPWASLPSDAVASATPENWSYDHSDYKMGKGRIHRAMNDSTNMVNFGFPYAGPQHGTLVLRAHPASGKDAILRIERGQFLVHGDDDVRALVRFDDGEPIGYAVAGAADQSTETVFFRDYQGFVGRMLKAKRVRISVPVYRQGNPVFEFDVSGFDADAYLEKKNKG